GGRAVPAGRSVRRPGGGRPGAGSGGGTPAPGSDPDELPTAAIGLLIARGMTVAAAESLTGGLVTAALTTVPGASAVVRGGVVAYAADLKSALLGVDPGLLARVGTVHRDVALAMARGVRERLGASVGVA